VHDFGEVEGLFYLSMESVPGANLRERIRQGPMPVLALVLALGLITFGLLQIRRAKHRYPGRLN
jgi:hypothetical protein